MSTRDVILDAAAAVIRDRGLANATTRQIATTAGFSEATLYKHFADKVDLMLAVLRERNSGFTELGQALEDTTGDLEERLVAVAGAAIAFFSVNFPMLASIFSDRAILHGHKEGLHKHGGGPHLVNEAVIGYLRREASAGRIAADADVYAAAALLVGACMQHAFLGLMDWSDRRDDEAAARSFARTVIRGLEVHPG
ncbi:TetR/AcrR family transcriptional regulator [Winogradskya consettensis]|uniref:TetR/AcrR family transcriptional regulator n=1 Tax=Winogradskya consettensis TaxID=113560 RepID=UPI001BB35F05|nr:TetR/AcrR family transcriptional regulator [Actinoplanes consettensis]